MASPQSTPPARQDDPSVGEVIEYVKTYAKQETVDPLKRAGRYVGFGAAGGLITGLGVALLVLGLLRLVQSEWGDVSNGKWASVAAYAIALVAALILFGLFAWMANRTINRTILGKEDQS